MIKKTVGTDQSLNTSQDRQRKETPVISSSKPLFGERLVRNLAFSCLILLAVVSVRNEKLPTGETVLSAVREITDPQWGEGLGKISFVSRLFPEAVSVFFDDDAPAFSALVSPCLGEISHAWKKEEPYLSFGSSDRFVYAAAPGQVMSVAHGMDDERIVRVRHENGLETVYYDLAEARVREGDQVDESTCLGVLLSGRDAAFEARYAGRSFDPAARMLPREKKH